jgi:phenylacetate-CoA ligase
MVPVMPGADPVLLAPAPRDPAQPFWDPEAQTREPSRRRALQDERLRAMVRRIFEQPVPFYRDKLRAAGIAEPDDVKGVEDLVHVPLSVKQELRESEAAHPPIGDYRFTALRDCVRVGQSTGTTGTPTTMIWTRHDIHVEYESAARMFWRAGHRPGMLATHAHPAYLYGGGAMLSGAYEYFGICNLWVPPPDTDELAEQGIRAWMRFQPDIPFVGFSLGRYFEVSAKLKLDPMKDVGLRIPSMGPPGKGSPLMTAGLECYAYLGSPCGRSPGAHLNEDWAVVQAVDPDTGREVPDGEWGHLVVTTLDRDNGMLRYDLEEACALDRARCPCGETTIRGFWGGRFKDLLACQGRRFQAAEVGAALGAVAAVTKPSLEFVVVRPAAESAPLRVRVELAEGDAGETAGACRSALRERLAVEAEVEIVARGALPRSGFKATRVVDA